ncbi:hypothetical protein MMC22_009128 [Lobaria immixta]|nr:hypothetical protein [Lobaria immixta]
MRKQKTSRGASIHPKWPSPLPDVQCILETADILPVPTLPFDEGTIVGTTDILRTLIKRAEHDAAADDKIIMLKGDLLTIRNSTLAIFRREDEYTPFMKFSWLEPIADLFHLHMNFQSMIFEKLWGVPGEVIFLNRLHGILKQKNVDKAAKDFHHCDDFFRTIIGASLVERASMIGLYKKSRLQQPLQPSNKDGQLRNRSPREPDWIKIQKELALKLAPKYRDVVRENALLVLSYGLLYLDIADACRNG